ncbi:MAG: MATE family efflux transporter [Clostridia bacterium]|nr:MATE family efflux transporter [Clostridia bacterium]
MRKSVAMDMCHGPLFWNIVKFTIPIILSSVLQLLFNAADLVIVGRFCGSDSVGAVGATSSLTSLFVNFFVGLSVGAGVTVAQGIGAKNEKKVHYAVHTAIPTALVSGAILTVLGIALSKQALIWMSTPEEQLPLAALYMKIYFAGIIAMLLYNFGAAILRAAGDTKRPLIYLSIAGVLNVILNCVFVIVFHMDVAGVALATTISQCVSAVLVMITLMRRNDACKLSLLKMRFDRIALTRILNIGLPAGFQSTLFSISNVLIQSSVNSFGNVVVAGCAAASSVEGFVWVIISAFGQTALNFSGQNYGAGEFKRIHKVLGYCLVLVFAVGLVAGGLVFLFAEPLLSIYISDSPEAIRYGAIKITMVGLPYFIGGLMEVTTGTIRGMGRSVVTMLVTVIGVCGLRVLWVYTVFQQIHTLECLYLSYPISWSITFLVQLALYFAICKRRDKKLKNTLVS